MKPRVRRLRAGAHHFAGSAADAMRNLVCHPYPEPSQAWRWLRGVAYARHMLFAAVDLHVAENDEEKPERLFYGDIRSIGQSIAIDQGLSLRLFQSKNVQRLFVEAVYMHNETPPRFGADIPHDSSGYEALAWRTDLRLVTISLSRALQNTALDPQTLNQLTALRSDADEIFTKLLAGLERPIDEFEKAVQQVDWLFPRSVESRDQVYRRIQEELQRFGIAADDIYPRERFDDILRGVASGSSDRADGVI
jgi:hypothetical protein